MAVRKKLIVSTYLQYIFIALGVLILFAFVWQLDGVLLTFFLAAILAYVLGPLVRLSAPRYLCETLLFEQWRKPPISELVPDEEPASTETIREEPAPSVEGRG